MHSRLLHGIMKTAVHIHISLAEILTPYHTKDIQLVMSRYLFHEIFCHFLYIMIVCPSHTFITCNDNGTYLSFILRNKMTLTEERMLDVRHMTEDPGNGSLHIIEIWFRVLQDLLGLLHLGRRNHVHRIGDLHGVLNAFHTSLYFFCICHINTYLLLSLNSSAAFTIFSTSSSESCFVVSISLPISGYTLSKYSRRSF